ncbi:hypothetical protein BX600DRAFT_514733 [Xylariales sp. PMI_506]|nr:hypothetical protein BX600DRAFT_514733 [Xylariales sp. PMI_506]
MPSPSLACTPKRVTQRAPQSCMYCSRRKLRCSKTIPCSNCIDRGMRDRCHRETVILSSQSIERRKDDVVAAATAATSATSPSPPLHHQVTPSPSPYPTANIGRLAVTILPVEARAPTTPSTRPTPLPTVHTRDHVPAAFASTHPIVSRGEEAFGAPASPAEHNDASCAAPPAYQRGEQIAEKDISMDGVEADLETEAAMSLESLAWGTLRDSSSKAVPSIAVMDLIKELHRLIDPQRARDILEFHRVHVTWMHNVLYMPLFTRECSHFLDGQLQRDADWLALYCAVLCTGVYYMSPRQHESVGLRDGYDVAKRLYRITIDAIMKSDFMIIQSLHSLQAICVILLCAHSMGDGRRMKILLSCANTIAQNHCHRLHLPEFSSAKPKSFSDLVDKEIRKRLWCFLCTQDWYLIASKKSYSIFPQHGADPTPANCTEDLDDATRQGSFSDLPLAVSTQSTYMIYLFKFTSRYRALHDRLCAVSARNGSVDECFNEVLAADSELEALMSNISEQPPGSQGLEATAAAGRQRLWSQQRALVIVSWHQRLMIHRSFFCRSFQDKRYHYSRFVSLTAARNILRSFLHSYQGGGGGATDGNSDNHGQDAIAGEIWTVPTHAISGCIIMTLNWLFVAERHTLEQSDMELMHQCLTMLKTSPRPNTIVERGTQIIQYLLNQGPQQRFKKLDLNEISQIARDISTSASTSTLIPPMVSVVDQSFQANDTAAPVDNDHNSNNNTMSFGSADIHQFPDSANPPFDILDQLSGYLGENDAYMPYLYDPALEQGFTV